MAVIENNAGVTLDHILFATDFSPASEAAMAYARALAKRFASRITVANVIDLSVATRSEDAVVGLPLDDMRRESAENMERTLNELGEAGLRPAGRTVESHLPAAAVIGMAGDTTDLLVVGTHGRRGLQRFILGSFAEGVIHHAKCPVLTIGPKVKPLSEHGLVFSDVLFATDLHHHTTEKAAAAMAWAEDSVANIHLCHVVDHPSGSITDTLSEEFASESALRRLIPGAAFDWCNPNVDVEFGDPAERILQLADKHQADLIIMGARRSANWFTHFQGVAGKVIANATCPVMTICID
ncbi:MAG TPA: universal stress protein [Acidobacteriaceae bacterium]|jgi:nucleotide-binding universal stress UspA family protein